jgi:hypothetical protein
MMARVARDLVTARPNGQDTIRVAMSILEVE